MEDGKAIFTDKIKTKSKITLIEKKIVSQEGQEEIVSEKIITEDQAVAEVFNKFSINIVPNLKIPTDHGYDNDFIATDNQVTNAVNKLVILELPLRLTIDILNRKMNKYC